MESVKIYAKANLSLGVASMENGMHNLDMVVGSCKRIYDEIQLNMRPDFQVVFECDSELVPSDNTAVRMCRGFMERYYSRGVHIILKKGIPFEGGLGGSSAAAAGVCVLMQRLFGYKSDAEIMDLCRTIGSDVFYMTKSKFARLRGIGDEVQKIKANPLFAVVVKPSGGVNTRECFSLFDRQNSVIEINNDRLVDALERGDIEGIRANMKNHLQAAACSLNPNILPILNSMGGIISGSGSSVIQVYGSEQEAMCAAEKFGGTYTELF